MWICDREYVGEKKREIQTLEKKTGISDLKK